MHGLSHCEHTMMGGGDNQGVCVQTDREGETVSRENIPSAFRLRGPVNVTALQDALAYLIERHEVLRAKYVLQHGEILQVCNMPGCSLSRASSSQCVGYTRMCVCRSVILPD